jgi:hypothetical protein
MNNKIGEIKGACGYVWDEKGRSRKKTKIR